MSDATPTVYDYWPERLTIDFNTLSLAEENDAPPDPIAWWVSSHNYYSAHVNGLDAITLAQWPRRDFTYWDFHGGIPSGIAPIWFAVQPLTGTWSDTCDPATGCVLHLADLHCFVGVEMSLDGNGDPTGDVGLWCFVRIRGTWREGDDAVEFPAPTGCALGQPCDPQVGLDYGQEFLDENDP